MGFTGWHGKVKTLGYKGIKMGISFFQEAQFIRTAGMGSGLWDHTGSEGWRGSGTTHPYQWESS